MQENNVLTLPPFHPSNYQTGFHAYYAQY